MLSLIRRKFKLLPVQKIKILFVLWLSYTKNSSPVLVTVKRCEASNKVSSSSRTGGYVAWVARCLLTSRRISSIPGAFAKTLSVISSIFAAMMLLVDAFVSIVSLLLIWIFQLKLSQGQAGAWVCSPDCLKNYVAYPKRL